MRLEVQRHVMLLPVPSTRPGWLPRAYLCGYSDVFRGVAPVLSIHVLRAVVVTSEQSKGDGFGESPIHDLRRIDPALTFLLLPAGRVQVLSKRQLHQTSHPQPHHLRPDSARIWLSCECPNFANQITPALVSEVVGKCFQRAWPRDRQPEHAHAKSPGRASPLSTHTLSAQIQQPS